MSAVLRRSRLGVSALAIAALAAGCGSTTSTSHTQASAPTTTKDSATSSPAPAASVTFDQSNPGKVNVNRSGQVIKLGFTNDEVGAFSIPAFRIGAQEAVKLINQTGGVNGAKIKLDVCLTSATPESSINCANRFIQNGDVASVDGIGVGSDGALPVLDKAGLPYVSSNGWGPGQLTDPNAHLLEIGLKAFYDAPLQVMKSKGVSAVSAVMFGGVGGETIVDHVFRPLGPKYGITVDSDFVNLTSPDWASSVQAAIARGVGAILGYAPEPSCTQLVSAAKQASFSGLLFAGSCSDFIHALGAQAVGTYTIAQIFEPDYAQYAPPAIQANLRTYEQTMRADGQQQYLLGYAPWSFSSVMELRSLLETIPGGLISAKSITAAFARAKSTPGYLGPTLHCAEHPVSAEPSDCRANSIALQVVKAGGQVVRKPVFSTNSGFTSL